MYVAAKNTCTYVELDAYQLDGSFGGQIHPIMAWYCIKLASTVECVFCVEQLSPL